MPRLATNDTKDRYTRQVVKTHRGASGNETASYHKVYLYALDGSRIGFCDMFNDDTQATYPTKQGS